MITFSATFVITTDDVPGPNHYLIRVAHRPDGKKAPSFSMGSRSFPPNSK